MAEKKIKIKIGPVGRAFALRIQLFREGKRWSQAEMGGLLGVTQQAISLYELAKRQPSFDELVKLTLITGQSLDQLLNPNIALKFNEKFVASVPDEQQPAYFETLSKAAGRKRVAHAVRTRRKQQPPAPPPARKEPS